MNNTWKEIIDLINATDKNVSILRGDLNIGKNEINILQISQKSALGAVIYNTELIIIDNWIRIFGQGGKQIDSIRKINLMDDFKIPNRIDGMFIIANDIVGGIYALNAGKFECTNGEVMYFAPDTLEWESLEMQYSAFIAWAVCGNTNEFYSSMRWNNWEKIASIVKIDQGILIYPFLWSNEVNLETAEKKIVPFIELYNVNMDYRSRLGLE